MATAARPRAITGSIQVQPRVAVTAGVKRSGFEVFFARAEALQLIDAGPSDALESRLDHALKVVLPRQLEHAQRFDAWVRAEAAKAHT
jgi:hypothetical protein